MIKTILIKNDVYSFTDKCGMVIYNGTTFIGTLADKYNYGEVYKVLKFWSEYNQKEKFAACKWTHTERIGRNGILYFETHLISEEYGDTIEELIENLRGPKLELE